MNLEQIREKIDEIDDEILILILKRVEYSKLIADIKFKENMPLFDKVRENEILKKVKLKSADDYKYILPIFSEILKSSKIIQNDMIKTKKVQGN